MSILKTLPENAGPPIIYTRYPEIYGPWSKMSEALMNGPSSLSQAERELILAYAAGVSGCEFVYVAHAEVAYARGIENGLIDRLVKDPNSMAAEPRLRPLLAFVRKLILRQSAMSQADADVVFAGGWDEQALHDAIAICARASFMQRLVEGYGFTPLSREQAAKHAQRRIERGYVNLFAAFQDG
jgi:uncharacterized peroxidase-related enzyme